MKIKLTGVYVDDLRQPHSNHSASALVGRAFIESLGSRCEPHRYLI